MGSGARGRAEAAIRGALGAAAGVLLVAAAGGTTAAATAVPAPPPTPGPVTVADAPPVPSTPTTSPAVPAPPPTPVKTAAEETRPPLLPLGADEATWHGPSVVRRHTSPDRYLRAPDRPYRTLRVAATGDLLIHTPVRTRAALPGGGFDFGPQLDEAREDVAAADLALCHLEVPLSWEGPYSSYPLFDAPAELADAIRETGWDLCSTASNHSADRGFDGLVETLDVLDAAGVDHRGTHRSAAEAEAVRLHHVDGVDVGVISATYGLNGLPQPGGHAWAVQLLDVEQILDRADRLREAGADVVLASLHWGAEYRHGPTDEQRRVARQLIAAGTIDAIIGHHAHVVQPVEWIEGHPVVYGLGNFLSGQRPTPRRDGAVVTLELRERADGWVVESVHAQPTWVDDGYAVVTADPEQGGVLGTSAQRTLGYLGVPLSPPPPPEPAGYQR